MSPASLTPEARRKLERTVAAARPEAEAGAKAALDSLAVGRHEFYPHMSPEARKLRNDLRAHGRQLGDRSDGQGGQGIDHLIQAVAYAHWHRMLFARFLAENGLLLEPRHGVALTLEEARELARESGEEPWAYAARCAQRMLPGLFPERDPVHRLELAPERRRALERLLESLDAEVFQADDSLGWTYQYWQKERKDAVNRSEVKIGAEELPAVTQLFTERYMVEFLIHNTLGAWWAGRVFQTRPELARDAADENALRTALAVEGVSWDYLRFLKTDTGAWAPAAGVFEKLPENLAEWKILDPCCGSGHFLTALLRHLAPLRSHIEGKTLREAVDAVIRENLHGLELDPRCTQIAAFALALAAWTLPGAAGYRPLPAARMACSGLGPHARKEQWLRLAKGDERLEAGLEVLYSLFEQAPVLGSLIDPEKSLADLSLLQASVEEVLPLVLEASRKAEGDGDPETREMAFAAAGMADALELLSGKYRWVITNVPYLSRGNHGKELKAFCERYHAAAKGDLATAFLERCLGMCAAGGTTSLVTPQNWLFLTSYKKLRENLLTLSAWNGVARIGTGGFQTISGEVVNVSLLQFSNYTPSKFHYFMGIDVSEPRVPHVKAEKLKSDLELLARVAQNKQVRNPDARINLQESTESELLGNYGLCFQGTTTGDNPRYIQMWWEQSVPGDTWNWFQSTVEESVESGGRVGLVKIGDTELIESDGARIQGQAAFEKRGVTISQMSSLACTLYLGTPFDMNTGALVPMDPKNLPAIWCFCSSPEYAKEVRKIDQKLNVTTATLVKVPFDLAHWQKVAVEIYPNGLPEPHSEDPTQWLFKGHIESSEHPLHVAVTRLLGYRWPAELDSEKAGVRVTDEDRAQWATLAPFADADGIVPLTSLHGEHGAAHRLRDLLHAAYGARWTPELETALIRQTGSEARNLEDWLSEDFFAQHMRLFQNRPFIWHIWDGRKRDGFSALVNYHRLAGPQGEGRRTLESLAYTYLGDHIRRLEAAVKAGEGAADARLASAQELAKRLDAILIGEPPFDLFIRWKPLHRQPIGWEPDIDDGVRLNLRPFVCRDIPGGKAGAGILRAKVPLPDWEKADRGNEPQKNRPAKDFPWFWDEKGKVFHGKRWNKVELPRAVKEAAREAKRPEEAQAVAANRGRG